MTTNMKPTVSSIMITELSALARTSGMLGPIGPTGLRVIRPSFLAALSQPIDISLPPSPPHLL